MTETAPGAAPAESPPAESLADLLALIATGDRAAFRRLYEATSPKLLGIAMLLLRNRRDAAEDALQEGYLRIWTKAHRYDAARGLALAWMAQIIRNAALDRRLRDGPEHADIADHADLLPGIVAALPDTADLKRGIADLAPSQQQYLLLSYLYGYTSEEIAEQLGKPLGTVKSTIRRGAERLRRTMACS